MSHRAFLLGGLAEGVSHFHHILEGDDVMATCTAMAAMGARATRLSPGEWQVEGVGRRGLMPPPAALDFGNAGTGSRLAMGLVAGQGIAATFVGDESLSARPMGRVLDPLAQLGIKATSREGKLPVTLKGGKRPSAGRILSAHASAQVKSAVLLAALGAHGTVTYVETERTRDHTERMLPAFGVPVDVDEAGSGVREVSVTGPVTPTACTLTIAGDPSSAAFLAAAAAIVPGSDVLLEGVMWNPTRTGFFDQLARMGADLEKQAMRETGGETVCDLIISSAPLRGIDVPASIAPDMIDEYPILAVCAAFATGTTRFNGVGELRVKESDRLEATAALLKRAGITVRTGPDWMEIDGGVGGGVDGGAMVRTHHDHRIAMSALVLGLASAQPMAIDDVSKIATSYPAFFDHIRSLGGHVEVAA